jgi:hypothetical protein
MPGTIIGGASTSAVTLGIDEYLFVLAGGSLALGGGPAEVGVNDAHCVIY